MRDSFTALVGGVSVVLLIVATAVPRMHSIDTQLNTTDGVATTVNYGIYSVQTCESGACTMSRQRCDNPTGTDCETSFAARCKVMKAFAVIAILAAAVGAWSSACQAHYDAVEHPNLLEIASDPASAIAYSGATISCLIIFSTWANYARGPVNLTAQCGLGGKGDVGVSFIFFILTWLSLGMLAILYICRVYDIAGAR